LIGYHPPNDGGVENQSVNLFGTCRGLSGVTTARKKDHIYESKIFIFLMAGHQKPYRIHISFQILAILIDFFLLSLSFLFDVHLLD
jgi:hypothetical protein